MQELKPEIMDWLLGKREGIQRLERIFADRDFGEALSFTNRAGVLAGTEGELGCVWEASHARAVGQANGSCQGFIGR